MHTHAPAPRARPSHSALLRSPPPDPASQTPWLRLARRDSPRPLKPGAGSPVLKTRRSPGYDPPWRGHPVLCGEHPATGKCCGHGSCGRPTEESIQRHSSPRKSTGPAPKEAAGWQARLPEGGWHTGAPTCQTGPQETQPGTALVAGALSGRLPVTPGLTSGPLLHPPA